MFILIIFLIITLSIIRQSSKISIKPIEKPLIEDYAIELPIPEEGPVYGNPGSVIRVSVFFSFKDGGYAKIHEELINFINKNPGKVHYYPKVLAKENWLGNKEMLPIFALNCADKQEKYWDFLSKAILSKKIDEAEIEKINSEIKIDNELFSQCLQNKEIQTSIETEQTNLQILGFTQTPSIFVNNRKINLTDELNISDILNGIIKK